MCVYIYWSVTESNGLFYLMQHKNVCLCAHTRVFMYMYYECVYVCLYVRIYMYVYFDRACSLDVLASTTVRVRLPVSKLFGASVEVQNDSLSTTIPCSTFTASHYASHSFASPQ